MAPKIPASFTDERARRGLVKHVVEEASDPSHTLEATGEDAGPDELPDREALANAQGSRCCVAKQPHGEKVLRLLPASP